MAIFGEVGSNFAAPEYMFAIMNGKSEVVINPKKCDIFSLGLSLLRCSALLENDDLVGMNHVKNAPNLVKLINGKVGCRGKYFVELFKAMT